MRKVCTLAVLCLVLAVDPIAAAPRATQVPSATLPEAAIPREEAAALAQGWVLLAEGRYDEASQQARQVANRYPRNIAAVSLLVEADIARGGATVALGSYESWLGNRTVEAPAVIRRVARAMLYEWSRQTTNGGVQAEALEALAQDGDLAALSTVSSIVRDGIRNGQESGLRMGVRMMDSESVATLTERLRSTTGLKLRDIQLLSTSGSPDAVAALVEVLSDPLAENRAAAADALGNIGGAQVQTALRPVLNDPNGVVRTAAAAALYRLGNFEGANILNDLAASDEPAIRRTAAMLMSSQPDARWKGLVRDLMADPDPLIRLDAAKMMAPHDPEAARQVFDQLQADDNMAIREETELAMAELPVATWPELRQILRTGRPLARVRAAKRILELTR